MPATTSCRAASAADDIAAWNRTAVPAFAYRTMPEPMMEDDRIIRIARALCRSARIDPDSILSSGEFDETPGKVTDHHVSTRSAVPAWTMFRGAALTFVHSHDDRIVSPL